MVGVGTRIVGVGGAVVTVGTSVAVAVTATCGAVGLLVMVGAARWVAWVAVGTTFVALGEAALATIAAVEVGLVGILSC
ncbi:hypothetical protein ABTM72_19475, partial [Acinetobacter baumannii]